MLLVLELIRIMNGSKSPPTAAVPARFPTTPAVKNVVPPLTAAPARVAAGPRRFAVGTAVTPPAPPPTVEAMPFSSNRSPLTL
jgi:hypothetical protein